MFRCLKEINIENMNVDLVAKMFKNYQSNVLFHLEGKYYPLADLIWNGL
jgi:DASH complex subunit DAD4